MRAASARDERPSAYVPSGPRSTRPIAGARRAQVAAANAGRTAAATSATPPHASSTIPARPSTTGVSATSTRLSGSNRMRPTPAAARPASAASAPSARTAAAMRASSATMPAAARRPSGTTAGRMYAGRFEAQIVKKSSIPALARARNAIAACSGPPCRNRRASPGNATVSTTAQAPRPQPSTPA